MSKAVLSSTFRRASATRAATLPTLGFKLNRTTPRTISTPATPATPAASAMESVSSTDACPAKGPYSQAMKTPMAVYCSGQIPMDANGVMEEGSIADKTARCFKNITAILTAAGTSTDKIVKINVFLTDMAFFAEMNGEYAKWVPHKPARSCVAVKQLPLGVDVEIECIALP